ncbi:MAG TPA: hypothetical protein VNA89_03130 [Gemmatimonadaceae bacterium]|nr:hypothetical protein [Gemmatimonadaceae bacterium]
MTNDVRTFDEFRTRHHRPAPPARVRRRRLGVPLLGLLAAAGFLLMAAAVEFSAPIELLRMGAAAVVLGLVGLATFAPDATSASS